MYKLFSNNDPSDDIVTARAKPYLSPDSELALSTMTNIVIDIANAFIEHFLDFQHDGNFPKLSISFL